MYAFHRNAQVRTHTHTPSAIYPRSTIFSAAWRAAKVVVGAQSLVVHVEQQEVVWQRRKHGHHSAEGGDKTVQSRGGDQGAQVCGQVLQAPIVLLNMPRILVVSDLYQGKGSGVHLQLSLHFSTSPGGLENRATVAPNVLWLSTSAAATRS